MGLFDIRWFNWEILLGIALSIIFGPVVAYGLRRTLITIFRRTAMFGKELILDIHHCDPTTFTRKNLKKYLKALVAEIEMQACDLHFWDYDLEQEAYELAPDHLKGISAIQFIATSNITIHTLDVLESAYINVFSCKDFDSDSVKRVTKQWLGGEVANCVEVTRI